jgi:hypothetical protein
MLIAQALGEYGGMSALAEAIGSSDIYLQKLGREWGLIGLGLAIAAAIVWKLLTRVR